MKTHKNLFTTRQLIQMITKNHSLMAKLQRVIQSLHSRIIYYHNRRSNSRRLHRSTRNGDTKTRCLQMFWTQSRLERILRSIGISIRCFTGNAGMRKRQTNKSKSIQKKTSRLVRASRSFMKPLNSYLLTLMACN